MNVEQQLAADLGAFVRAGKAPATSRPTNLRISIARWPRGCRCRARAGIGTTTPSAVAALNNGISGAREAYLNAGGLGILIGDGRLPHPGPEQIIETYYSAALFNFAHLSLDYQWINHPAYNRDRGPVSVIAVRLHAQF